MSFVFWHLLLPLWHPSLCCVWLSTDTVYTTIIYYFVSEDVASRAGLAEGERASACGRSDTPCSDAYLVEHVTKARRSFRLLSNSKCVSALLGGSQRSNAFPAQVPFVSTTTSQCIFFDVHCVTTLTIYSSNGLA
jgi:hypothetical protein